jgi:hypothetical protein
MVQNLLKIAVVKQIQNGAAAGTTLITSSTFNSAGFNACLVFVSVGTVLTTAVMQLTLQQGAQANGSDATNITGAQTPSFTDAGGASSNSIFIVDAMRFTKQYLTATFSRTTANVVVNGMWAVLYQANTIPVTLDATVTASILESGN